MSTLPCYAAELDLCSGVFYAASLTGDYPPGERLVVWMPSPTMTDDLAALYHWTTAAEADALETPHITLNTVAYATLLFLSGVDPLADDLDDATALAAIDAALTDARCDMLRCVWRANTWIDEHPWDCSRWHQCEIRVARLTGVTP